MAQINHLKSKHTANLRDQTKVAKGLIDNLPEGQYKDAILELLENLMDAIAQSLADLEQELKK